MSKEAPKAESDSGSKPSKVWTTVARLAVGVTIVIVLLLRVEWQEIQRNAVALDIGSVALAGLCFIAIAVIESVRLRLAFPVVPFSDCLRIHLIGVFIGAFLPGQLGSDVYKTAILKRPSGGIGQAASMVILVRSTGLLVMAGAATLAALHFAPLLAPMDLRVSALSIGLAASALAAIALAALTIRRFFPGVSIRVGHELTSAMIALRQVRPQQFGELTLLSVLVLGLRGGSLFFLVTATGFRIGWLESIVAASLIAMAAAVPIGMAGLGLREGAVVLLLTAMGIGYESTILVALLGRTLMIAMACIGGAVAWLTPTPLKQ